METKLNISNFFTYYMFHPNDETLSESDRKIAKIATAILGVVLVGIVHIFCRLLCYRNINEEVESPEISPIVRRSNIRPKAPQPKVVPFEPVIRSFNNIVVTLVEQDNICESDSDAIVNAANKNLRSGSGVCGAIRKSGGEIIFKECSDYLNKTRKKMLKEGEAIITSGGSLKAKKVIHAVGPDWGKGKEDKSQQLYDAYYNSLLRAHESSLNSITFPSISTGIYKFPLNKAASIAMEAFKEFAENNPESTLETITMALRHDTFPYYRKALEDFAEEEIYNEEM